MVKINMTGFKNVEFQRGDLVLKQGGLPNKPVTLHTKEIRSGEAGGFQAIYIRVKSKESWLGPACMGRSTRGELHMGVIKDLQHRVTDIETRIRRGAPPLEDTAAPEVDPMDELGDFDEPARQDNKQTEGKKSMPSRARPSESLCLSGLRRP